VAILISYAFEAAAVAPVVGDDPVERILSENDMPEGVVKLPAPAAEPITGPFGIEPVVGDLLVRPIRVRDLCDSVQRFSRVTAVTPRIVIITGANGVAGGFSSRRMLETSDASRPILERLAETPALAPEVDARRLDNIGVRSCKKR
jgi:hypothetical protein